MHNSLMKWLIFGMRIVLMAVILHGGMAWGFTVTMKPYIPATDPEPPYAALWLSCYDIANRQKLNCGYTITLRENENTPDSGGHIDNGHSGNRPLGMLTKGETGEKDAAFIEGTTQEITIINFYETPEVSGIAEIEIVYTFPPGYICVYPPDCTFKRTMMVKIPPSYLEPPLVSLESLIGPLLFELTGQTDGHPENHFGMPETRDGIVQIANKYWELTDGDRLQINDMSLVWGGAFDLCNTWNPLDTCDPFTKGGHSSHRTGTDVDIDRWVEEVKILCEEDDELLWATQIVADANNLDFPDLNCESGGRKHIDFD